MGRKQEDCVGRRCRFSLLWSLGSIIGCRMEVLNYPDLGGHIRMRRELSDVAIKASYKSKEYRNPNPTKIGLWIKAMVAKEVLRRVAEQIQEERES